MPPTPGQGQEIRDCPGDSLFAHARIFQISEYPSNLPCNGDVNIFIVNYNNINVSILYYTMQSNTTIINIHDYNITKEIIQYFISKRVKATPTKID